MAEVEFLPFAAAKINVMLNLSIHSHVYSRSYCCLTIDFGVESFDCQLHCWNKRKKLSVVFIIEEDHNCLKQVSESVQFAFSLAKDLITKNVSNVDCFERNRFRLCAQQVTQLRETNKVVHTIV